MTDQIKPGWATCLSLHPFLGPRGGGQAGLLEPLLEPEVGAALQSPTVVFRGPGAGPSAPLLCSPQRFERLGSAFHLELDIQHSDPLLKYVQSCDLQKIVRVNT